MMVLNREMRSEVFEATRKLIMLLENRLDENLERIFKLLELKYPPEEIDTVYRNLKSDKTDLRINAIEFLDNLLDVSLKKVLIPIIESVTLETITRETLKNLNIRVPGQLDCLELILHGKDRQLKMAVIDLIDTLEPPGNHTDQSNGDSTRRALEILTRLKEK